MSQEREHMENLVNQRFNFFLIFFSLVVGGAATCLKFPLVATTILGIGTIISWLLWASIARAQFKLDTVFKSLPKQHPASLIDLEVRFRSLDNQERPRWVPKCFVSKSQRKLIGYTIPRTCCLVLTCAFVFAFCYCLCNYRINLDICNYYHVERSLRR